MFLTLNDLREKEVISVTDGSRYGYVGDLSVDMDTGQVRALIVPGEARFFGLFGRTEDRLIQWDNVRRFGEDIILVEGTPAVRPHIKGRFPWL
ncbi:MAG: YlmC/YmxH family sporulation protein [Clostridiales bacterium]|nr:YlmC/YmxH family sporulation protein [Clostridiales bacterium]MCC8100323.1 YlmC/YmxH family sporulation protein [Clostridiales bacterium]MCD7919029.1 YlmC/YmxH family sporulation protein [Clostridiales bacterium]MCD8126693.1 YlmC/YmxH family sporulation protein [Clostridiales bacterium]MCD8143377.1 YlmC/YmxH family sporulation protein [Clostridiales bacterium]